MKKLSTLIIFFITLSCLAQDCRYLYDQIDDFSGKRSLGLKPVRIATMDNGFFLRVDLNATGDIVFLHVPISEKYGCATYDSYIMFKLEDGTVLESRNFGKTDCGERPSLYFRLDADMVEMLGNVPLSNIRLSTDRSLMDARKITHPTYFIENLKCLDL